MINLLIHEKRKLFINTKLLFETNCETPTTPSVQLFYNTRYCSNTNDDQYWVTMRQRYPWLCPNRKAEFLSDTHTQIHTHTEYISCLAASIIRRLLWTGSPAGSFLNWLYKAEGCRERGGEKLIETRVSSEMTLFDSQRRGVMHQGATGWWWDLQEVDDALHSAEPRPVSLTSALN